MLLGYATNSIILLLLKGLKMFFRTATSMTINFSENQKINDSNNIIYVGSLTRTITFQPESKFFQISSHV